MFGHWLEKAKLQLASSTRASLGVLFFAIGDAVRKALTLLPVRKTMPCPQPVPRLHGLALSTPSSFRGICSREERSLDHYLLLSCFLRSASPLTSDDSPS